MHNDQMLIQILMHSGSEVFPCSTGLEHTACALCTECASMHVGTGSTEKMPLLRFQPTVCYALRCLYCTHSALLLWKQQFNYRKQRQYFPINSSQHLL